MTREIYKVYATQIVTSPSNPQGVLSDVNGYPKSFDSRTYKLTEANPNGDRNIALLAAQADFKTEALALSTADSPNRVGWAVYILRMSDGERIDKKTWGAFPDMTPQPEPTHAPEPEEAE